MLDDENLKLRLKQNLPAIMEARGMTVSALARSTGDSYQQVDRAVKGLNCPGGSFLHRLAEALECSMDELCSDRVPHFV